MKISQIVLYNVGPYIDRNEFNISVRDKNKNIVLIGGKNGAGKTTFFKSIKTCLYGSKVWGFDAAGKEYFNIIDSLINIRNQYNDTVKAYVEIELRFEDGKQLDTYRLHREWKKTKKSISETFIISKNDDVLEDDIKADFINYLLSIIPPDMFNFYFFDGESIADFFLGNNGNKNFKNAFLKLYGLDTLSIMIDNFNRYNKRKIGLDNAYETYKSAKLNIEKISIELDSLRSQKDELENKIDLYHVKIKALNDDYARNGGVSFTEWKELTSNLNKEESRREELNRWLKDAANNNLPFVILKGQMKALLEELEAERSCASNQKLVEVFKDKKFNKKFADFLAKYGLKSGQAKEITDFIVSETDRNSEVPLFDLSSSQYNRLIAQIIIKSQFDGKAIIKTVREIESSIKSSKKLREQLLASSIDGYDNLVKEKTNIEKEISSLTVQLEKITQDILIKEIDKEQADDAFVKAKTDYEKMLKNKSITSISSRAVAAYTLLEEELIVRQGKLLQQEFIKYFSSIINKDNFIDSIVIDKNINVIPYKLVDVTFVQIDNYLRINEKTHFLELFDKNYIMEVNKLRMGLEDSIKLPSPISAPFSQGERQIYIMSLYLALLKTSRKDIPFFIDTPFARIDSNHRSKIVNEFFRGISNQMFILSTDEEIVGIYKDMLEDKISNKFLLCIDSYGKTDVKENIYFED
mgnify:FL=1